MNWLPIYAGEMTGLAVWFGFGWYFAHSILEQLKDIEPDEWLMARNILRRLR